MGNFIITIARQYGSGGREVGLKLSEKIAYKFYDKNLITLAAQKSGLSSDALNVVDEKAASDFGGGVNLNAGIAHATLRLPASQKIQFVPIQPVGAAMGTDRLESVIQCPRLEG